MTLETLMIQFNDTIRIWACVDMVDHCKNAFLVIHTWGIRGNMVSFANPDIGGRLPLRGPWWYRASS